MVIVFGFVKASEVMSESSKEDSLSDSGLCMGDGGHSSAWPLPSSGGVQPGGMLPQLCPLSGIQRSTRARTPFAALC